MIVDTNACWCNHPIMLTSACVQSHMMEQQPCENTHQVYACLEPCSMHLRLPCLCCKSTFGSVFYTRFASQNYYITGVLPAGALHVHARYMCASTVPVAASHSRPCNQSITNFHITVLLHAGVLHVHGTCVLHLYLWPQLATAVHSWPQLTLQPELRLPGTHAFACDATR